MAWSRIQSAKTAATGTALTSVSATYGSNVSSGTKLIVAVGTSGSTGTTVQVTSVKDGAGNSFTLCGRADFVSGSFTNTDATLWAIDTPAGDVGTKPTITATLGAGTADMGILIQEVSGLAAGNTTAAMLDGTAGTLNGSGGSSTGSPTYSSTAANEYLVSVYGDDGGPLTWTKPSALTADANSVNTSSFSDIALAYGNSTGGTESGSWGLSGTAADWGTVLVAFKLAATSISGTGSVALAGLAFTGSGGSTTGTGSLSLAAFAFSGTGGYTSGSGSFRLAALGFHGGSTPSAPVVPAEQAGQIALSVDHNAWSQAATFLLGSGPGETPVFYLMAATSQALTTSFTEITFSSSAAIFKDNAGGFSSSNPIVYTIQLAGYYTIEWAVSAVGGNNLTVTPQVITGASNPYNPSTFVLFQNQNRPFGTTTYVASSRGLVPIYLVPGDFIELTVETGANSTTDMTFPPYMAGQWVSK